MRFAAEAARHLRASRSSSSSEHKLDRPSGTAAATAERISRETGAEVPIHSVRLPGLVAHQETLLAGAGEPDDPARRAVARGVRPRSAARDPPRARSARRADRRARGPARIVSGADYNLRVSAGQPLPSSAAPPPRWSRRSRPTARSTSCVSRAAGGAPSGGERLRRAVLAGTTGEAPTLCRRGEARAVSRRCSRRSAVTRTSSPTPGRTTPVHRRALTRLGRSALGRATAFLAVTPYSNELPARGRAVATSAAIADSAGRPCRSWLYNIPQRVIVNVLISGARSSRSLPSHADKPSVGPSSRRAPDSVAGTGDHRGWDRWFYAGNDDLRGCRSSSSAAAAAICVASHSSGRAFRRAVRPRHGRGRSTRLTCVDALALPRLLDALVPLTVKPDPDQDRARPGSGTAWAV